MDEIKNDEFLHKYIISRIKLYGFSNINSNIEYSESLSLDAVDKEESIII